MIRAIAVLWAVCSSFAFAQVRPGAPGELDLWTLDGVRRSSTGALAPAPSLLLTDENGATSHNNRETLSASVWARKQFQIDTLAARKATLYLCGSAKAITVNGKPVGTGRRYPSTGWHEVEIPVDLLRSGLNDIVFAGPGSLVVENCRQPNRSARSTDAGKTWDFDHLGDDGFNDGEYLVRLRLEQTPANAWAVSPIAVLPGLDGSTAEPPAKFVVEAKGAKLPALEYRTGSTPDARSDNWSEWKPVPAEGIVREPTHAFAQLRAKFTEGAELASLRVVGSGAGAGFALENSTPWIARSSEPMAFEPFGRRLAEVRQKHKLDAVVAGISDEFEAMIRLRHHVRNLWDNGWEMTSGGYCPPWDVRMILNGQPNPECLTMCTHYSVVFTQFAQSLGWNARPAILDHHCVAEIWSNRFNKWVMMDTGNTKKRKDLSMHMVKDGIPLSCEEIHRAAISGDTAGITLVFGDGSKTDELANMKNYPICQLENWRRFCVPRRTNFLTSPFPGELEHGFSQYFHDGYLWWEDAAEPKFSREYSRQSNRVADLYPQLNAVALHAVKTGPAELTVHFETLTPNFAGYQSRASDADPWKDARSPIKLKVTAEPATLQVRSVNKFGLFGPVSRLSVKAPN